MKKNSINTFLIIRGIALVIDQTMAFALPLLVYQNSKSISLSGIAYLVDRLIRVLALPWFGSIADRDTSSISLVLNDIIKILLSLLLIIQNSSLFLIFITPLFSLLSAMANVILQAKISSHNIGGETFILQRNMQIWERASEILSPVIAGSLLGFGGINLFIIIICFIWLLTAIITFYIRSISFTRYSNNIISFKNYSYGFLFIFKKNILRNLLYISWSINLLDGILTAILPALFLGKFSISTSGMGKYISLGAISSIFFLVIIGKFIKNDDIFKLLRVSSIFLVISILVTLISKNFYFVIISFIFYSIFRSWTSFSIRTIRTKVVPSESQGKVIGAFMAASWTSLPLAGLFVSVFGQSYLINCNIIIIGLICLLIQFKAIYILNKLLLK